MITAAPVLTPEKAILTLPDDRWQAHWRQAIRDPAELLAVLGLDAEAMGVSAEALAQFALRVPRGCSR